jgi:hypothetical protein
MAQPHQDSIVSGEDMAIQGLGLYGERRATRAKSPDEQNQTKANNEQLGSRSNNHPSESDPDQNPSQQGVSIRQKWLGTVVQSHHPIMRDIDALSRLLFDRKLALRDSYPHPSGPSYQVQSFEDFKVLRTLWTILLSNTAHPSAQRAPCWLSNHRLM